MRSDTGYISRPIAASSIISNNMQVSLHAFWLGLTAGIGTVGILIFKSMHLGAIAGGLLSRVTAELCGWIMPHGGVKLCEFSDLFPFACGVDHRTLPAAVEDHLMLEQPEKQ